MSSTSTRLWQESAPADTLPSRAPQARESTDVELPAGTWHHGTAVLNEVEEVKTPVGSFH